MEYINAKGMGLVLSKIGFGGIPIQKVDSLMAGKIVDELVRRGVNYIDSARGYKNSEKLIGEAIARRRDKFILATKSMAKTYIDMAKDIEISLSNFKTDYIDIYQLHNPSMDSLKVIMGEGGALKALLEAKEKGKIGHIGITSHSLDVLNSVIDLGIFESVMYPFNIVEVQGRSFFKKCKEKGILTIAMKPMAGGALDDKNLALKFLLNEDIDIIIPGMGSVEEVIENCSINNTKLSKEELEEIDTLQKTFGNDFCRRCGYCQPCTKGIDIANCFVFEGYYKRYDLKDWAKERYESLKSHASDCVECGKCMERCPYKLNIIEKLKGVKETFGK